jgi:hypothetical protein
MENTLINLVFHEIDIITKKQIMIANLNDEVEDRRIRLVEFIQSSDELGLSRKACGNILENVSNMKMEVMRTEKDFKENVEEKVEKRCIYHNKGYCKFKNECKYVNSGQVCGKFLKDGKCESEQICKLRHPKDCKYWKQDENGCHRKESCKHLHRLTQSNNVKSPNDKNCEEEKDLHIVDSGCNIDKIENNDTAEMVVDTEDKELK